MKKIATNKECNACKPCIIFFISRSFFHNIFYFERKRTFMHLFYCICSWEFVYHDVLFLSYQISWKGVSYSHKMLRLRCCRGPTSSSVSTNMSYKCKQSYSSVWRKITTGHCEFNVRALYLIFKILYHPTKTQPIVEVSYEQNTM